MTHHCATVALFADHLQTEAGVRALQHGGFDLRQLSIIGKNHHREEHVTGLMSHVAGGLAGADSAALADTFSLLGLPPVAVQRYERAVRAGRFALIAHGQQHDIQVAYRLLEGARAWSSHRQAAARRAGEAARARRGIGARLEGLGARLLGRGGQRGALSVLAIHDLQGRPLLVLADLRPPLEVALPAGTYHVSVQLAGVRRRYTVSLAAGACVDLRVATSPEALGA